MKPLHERLTAVESCSQSNVIITNEACHIVRMQSINKK